MADGSDLGASMARWDRAVANVDRWLMGLAAGVTRLGAKAAGLYPARNPSDGWRVPITFGSGARRFDILIRDGFPFDPPLLALFDRPPHLTWPHVEADGVLCLLPNAASVSATNPTAVVKRLLAEAVRLVEESEAGTNIDDFRAEFLSYWPNDADAPPVWSLLEPRGPSRPIVAYPLKDQYVVAETRAVLTAWLDHTVPVEGSKRNEVDPALLIWLDQPMLPVAYPATSQEVISRVRLAGLGANLDLLGTRQLQRIVVIFGAHSQNGPSFAAVVLRPKASERTGRRVPPNGGIERGFRPGHAPANLITRRFLATTRPWKASVERIDAAWIHGRDNDPELPRLRAANVVVVGCGSLGGPLALALAQACGATIRMRTARQS